MRVLSRPVHLLSVSALLCTLVATLPVAPVPPPTPSDHGIVSSTRIIPLPGPVLPTHAATARPQRAADAPMVPGTHWYLAAQYVAPGARVRQEVAFLNPNAVPAPVTIAVYIARHATPVLVRLTLRAGVSRVVDLDSETRGATLGSTQVALSIVSPRVISVQRVLVRRQRDGRPFGVDITPGVPAPSRTWSFPEGYVGLTYRETLTLFNPGPRVARVTVRFAPQGNGPSPVAPVRLNVPAFGQRALDVRRAYGRRALPSVGLLVASTEPVVAGRTLYWGANGDAGQFGADAKPGLPSPSTRWYAAGASLSGQDQPFVALVAPGGTARATVEVRDARGHLFILPRALIPGGHRATILLARGRRVAGPVALVVRADRPILVEVPQYSAGSPNAGRHAGDVISAVAGVAPYGHLPYLRTDRGAAAALITVYNPGRRALTVTVRGFTASGRTAARAIVVPAGGTVLYDVDALNLPRGPLGVTLAATRDGFVAYAQSASGVASTFMSEEAIPLPAVALAAVQGPGPGPLPPAGLSHSTATPTSPNLAASATTVSPSATATPIPSDTPASGGLTIPTRAAPFASATAVPSSSPLPPPPASATPAPAPRLTLALSAPMSVTPGMAVPYVVTASNVSTTPATRTVVTLTFPDGTSSLFTLGAVAPGATVTGTLSWVVPAVPAKGVAEADADYLTRLGQADGVSLAAYATLSWQDATGAPSSPVAAQAASTEHLPILQYTAVSGPDTLVPGTVVTTTVMVRNTGSGDASAVTTRVRNPDGSISGAQGGAVASGAATTLDVSWLVPTMPHATTERDDAYAARLTAEETQTQPFTVGLGWHDERLNSYGQIGAVRTATERVPVVAIAIDGPKTPAPGTTVTYTVSLTNTGSVAAALLGLTVVMPDSALRVPDAGGALGPGESRQVTIPYTVPLTLPAGAFVAHARVTWQDSAQNAYGPRAADAATTIADEPALHIGLSGPSTATAGDTITYTVTLTNSASSTSADAIGARVSLIFPDRSRRTVDVGDAIASGTSRSLPVIFTIPTTQTVGDAPALAAVTWKDDAGKTLGPREASTVTKLTALPTATATATGTNTPTATPTSTPTDTATPADTATNTPTNTPLPYKANGLDVYLGYADNARANPNLPVPWLGSPNTQFIGNGGSYDSGAIRLDNTTGATITVSDVSTFFPNHNEAEGQTFDLWGSFTVAPHGTTILAQTNGQNFDTSDYGIPGFSCGNLAGPNDSPPHITIKVGDGPTTVLSDTGHILDTGGVDSVNCYGNESLQWRALGTIGSTQAAANLVLIAPSSDPVIGAPYTQTAQLTDPSGHGLPNVAVNFAVNSGPNVGVTGQGTTDSSGIATFTYTGTVIGTDAIVASVTNSSGATFTSDPISVTWVTAPPTPRPTITPTSTPIPTDTPTQGPTRTPGPSATPIPSIESPGWIGSPRNGAQVSGLVPIMLTLGETLQSGTVDYYPADDPSSVTTLATITGARAGTLAMVGRHAGLAAPPRATGGTIATLDTTTLEDGSYIIRVRGADTNGNSLTSEVYVIVVGDNKPGRVAFTQTDLTVPVAGLPISIGRTYDSLLRGRTGDFGHGWSLSQFNAHLQVDPAMNVTLDLPNGKRSTFSFAPQGHFLYYTPSYIANPGVYGTLTADGCFLFEPSSNGYYCLFGDGPNGMYQPGTYTYTDPYGRVYVYGADGSLRSERDLSGNTLTIGPSGIVSSAGNQVVSFARDGQDRITSITDPDGHVYRYGYDAAGNLASVTLPSVATPLTFTYDSSHLLKAATDARGYHAALTTYYPDGRLQSLTDALGSTTGYTYSIGSSATTTYATNPDGGVITSTSDISGNLTSQTDQLGHTTAYTYDGSNNLTSQTDPLGHTTTYTYDGVGHPTSITSPLGHTIHVTYGGYGGPSTIVDQMGYTQTIQYGLSANNSIAPSVRDRINTLVRAMDQRIVNTPGDYLPSSVQDSLGTLGRMTYDLQGNAQTQTDANGKVTSYTYDAYGNRTSQTDPLGRTTASTYDDLGRRISGTDALGRTTRYAYDGMGRLVTVVDPQGQVTRYEYDANGNRMATIDTLGRRMAYGYDGADRLATTTYPDGTATGATYDFRGNPLSKTDQSGRVTRDTYDIAGNLTSVTDAAGTADASTTSYGYDAAGRRTSVTDPRGYTTRYSYDDAGHLTGVTDPLGHTTAYMYNAEGRAASTTDANGHTTGYAHDARGRLTGTTYADGTSTSETYDGVGNLMGVTDQLGRTTAYGYDDAGELLSATDPLGETTAYSYDRAGNLATVTDANGHQTSMTYDVVDRLVARTWPDGSAESYGYDASGNQTSHVLADGHTNSYSYDTLDRPTGVAYFDGQRVAYSYTPTGQRETATDGRGVTRYAYDNQDRPVSITQPTGQQLSYGYDAAGNRTSLTTPVGTTGFTYDAAGQLSAVTDPSHGTTAYTYDGAGNRTGLTLPNGVTTDYTYNRLDRLTGMVQHKADQAPLASYAYTLDANGDRTGVREADGSAIGWSYDAAGRFTSETRYGSGGAATSRAAYSYDAVGNRLSMDANGTTTSYTYNALDQLVSAGATGYSYDRRGNLVGVAAGGASTRYSYDAADRLAGATLPNGTTTSYGYDADGNRVSQTVDGAATNYVWDPTSAYGDVVQETDASGATQATYTLGDGEVLSQTRGGSTSYYLRDGQGSTRALTDGNGTVTDRYSYDAFGNLQNRQGSTANPYLYTGQQYDATTGLYDLRARYYNPADGRFTSRDTAGFDQSSPTNLDRYLYAASDPINGADPSGYEDTAEYGLLLSLAAVIEDAFVFAARAYVENVAWDLACRITGAVGGDTAEKLCTIASYVGNPKDLVNILRDIADQAARDAERAAVRDAENAATRDAGNAAGAGAHGNEPSDSGGGGPDSSGNKGRSDPENAPCTNGCFATGTLVATAHGEQAIQTLHVGEMVLSEDPSTHQVDTEPLQRVTHDPRSLLLAVDLSDGSTITTTLTHPFYVDNGVQIAVGGAWLWAEHLQSGDQLRTEDGHQVSVLQVRQGVGYADVWTLTVARDHTFFVGTAQVLVHNCDSAPNSGNTTGANREQQVANHFGNEVVNRNRLIRVPGVGSTDIDVELTGNRYIEVGGPAKGASNAAFSKFGTKLKVLTAYAKQQGGQAYFYYEPGTPQQVIDFAAKRLGAGNVIPIP